MANWRDEPPPPPNFFHPEIRGIAHLIIVNQKITPALSRPPKKDNISLTVIRFLAKADKNTLVFVTAIIWRAGQFEILLFDQNVRAWVARSCLYDDDSNIVSIFATSG